MIKKVELDYVLRRVMLITLFSFVVACWSVAEDWIGQYGFLESTKPYIYIYTFLKYDEDMI